MRLILHVGMPKAGSTALQRGLKQLQDRLLEQGYLYPTGRRPFHNHNFLVAAVVPPEKLPRYFLPRYREKPDRVAHDFEKWIGDIRAQVTRHRPKALLMSGESLFHRSSPERCAKLAAVLRPLADEIEVVAYLRRPSDFYLSAAQQILKANHRIMPLAPVELSRPLEGFAAIADRCTSSSTTARCFPAATCCGTSCEAFCPEMSGEDLPRLDANVSLSAEGLSILAAYRRQPSFRQAAAGSRRMRSLLLEALSKADERASRQPPLPAEGGHGPDDRRGIDRPALAARHPRHRVRRHRLRPHRADGLPIGGRSGSTRSARSTSRGNRRSPCTPSGISPTRSPACERSIEAGQARSGARQARPEQGVRSGAGQAGFEAGKPGLERQAGFEAGQAGQARSGARQARFEAGRPRRGRGGGGRSSARWSAHAAVAPRPAPYAGGGPAGSAT